MKVYVQVQDNGQWLSTAGYACWYAFSQRGEEVVPFFYSQLRDHVIVPTADDIVQGGVGSVKLALQQLGAKEPQNFDLPASLSNFFGRRIWHSTMGDIRKIERYDPAIHVKPLHGHKMFAGRLLRKRDDLIQLTMVPSNVELLVQESVNFASEFRFYVLGTNVQGVGFYAGDPLLFPDSNVVRAMMQEFTDSPCAYGLDVGVDGAGRTLLVEVNDAFSLGFYGINPFKYADMIEARWKQLISS